MPDPAAQPARRHLRLAPAPGPRGSPEGRLALLARTLVATVALVLVTARAWVAATLALFPLLWRRAPLGRRLTPLAKREARVIPFQRRRQAMPR